MRTACQAVADEDAHHAAAPPLVKGEHPRALATHQGCQQRAYARQGVACCLLPSPLLYHSHSLMRAVSVSLPAVQALKYERVEANILKRT